MPLTLCGVEVSVHSGIRELVPLGDSTNAASDAATAFVASSLGQAFAIRVHNRTDKYLKVVLSVDGDGIGKYHLAPRKYGFHDAVAISAKIKAPMIFADYQVVSDYDPAAAKDTRELGTICVVVYEFKPEVRDNAKNMKLKTGWYDKKFTDYAYVPESSKKMGGHRMQIDLSGARKNTMRPSRWKAVNLEGRPPLCSFKFVYQPAAMLAEKGILRPGVVTRRVSLESRNGLSGWLGWFIQQF